MADRDAASGAGRFRPETAGVVVVLPNLYLTAGLAAIVAIGDVVWIATDPRPAAERWRRPMSLMYPRGTAALLPQIASGLLWPWPATAWDPLFISVGVAFLSIGMGLVLWARHVMGGRWAPPEAHDVIRQPELITTAPFSWSRNPIYLGVSLIVAGYAIAVRSVFVFIVPALVWSLRQSALREEEVLQRHFGAAYTTYKERVPRFMF
jgi:protein-S-isoprenylcysteine O-methyltransferase Ste14